METKQKIGRVWLFAKLRLLILIFLYCCCVYGRTREKWATKNGNSSFELLKITERQFTWVRLLIYHQP